MLYHDIVPIKEYKRKAKKKVEVITVEAEEVCGNAFWDIWYLLGNRYPIKIEGETLQEEKVGDFHGKIRQIPSSFSIKKAGISRI